MTMPSANGATDPGERLEDAKGKALQQAACESWGDVAAGRCADVDEAGLDCPATGPGGLVGVEQRGRFGPGLR